MRELCPWYALSVKHQHEQAVRSALAFKGFDAMVPTYRVRNRWSDRAKELDVPLFAGYVFCRFPLEKRIQILDTTSVVKIIGSGGNPWPVEEDEIEGIRTILDSKLAVCPWPYLKPGDSVRVEGGPLRGVEGQLLRENGSYQLVISVEILQRSISVSVDPEHIAPTRIVHPRVCSSHV